MDRSKNDDPLREKLNLPYVKLTLEAYALMTKRHA